MPFRGNVSFVKWLPIHIPDLWQRPRQIQRVYWKYERRIGLGVNGCFILILLMRFHNWFGGRVALAKLLWIHGITQILITERMDHGRGCGYDGINRIDWGRRIKGPWLDWSTIVLSWERFHWGKCRRFLCRSCCYLKDTQARRHGGGALVVSVVEGLDLMVSRCGLRRLAKYGRPWGELYDRRGG